MGSYTEVPVGRLSPQALACLREVVDGPLPDIAARLSRLLAESWPHEALVIFTRECTGRPRKVAGKDDIVDRVTIDELADLKRSVEPGGVAAGLRLFAGVQQYIWVVRDVNGVLLVIVPKRRGAQTVDLGPIAAVFGIVATSIQQQVTQASPDYLAESRAASAERARIITELTEIHDATLSSILATLRSNDLDDRRSRITASETASAALIELRTKGAMDRALSEEAVTTAFARLQGELRSILRHRDIDVDYVEPPADGRPLPGEIAHAARAMVRAVVLTLSAQTVVTRIRIAWDCDGSNLAIEVRDQGPGTIDCNALSRQLSGRVQTLNGQMDIESIAGWGSRIVLRVPLDPPVSRSDDHIFSSLNPRELAVLSQLADGARNKAIAAELGIAESTVKFHVASVLRKLGAENRGVAGAMAVRAGIVGSAPQRR